MPIVSLVAGFGNIRWTIGRKLGASFVLIAGLVCASVAVGVLGLSSLNGSNSKIVNQADSKELAADEATAAAKDMHFSATAAALGGESATLAGAPAHRTAQADRATFGQALDALRPVSTTAADKRALAAIDAALAAYDKGDATLYVTARRGDLAKARELVDGPQNDVNDALVKALDDYQQRAAAEQKATVAGFRSTSSSSTMVLLAAGGAILVLLAAVAFLLTRGITRSVRSTVTAAKSLASGDVDQRVAVRGTDELAEVARAFDEIADYLREAAGAAGRMAEGDLTVAIEPKSEKDALGLAFVGMRDRVALMLREIASTSGVLASSSQQMASTSDQAGRAVGEIAAAVGTVAAGAERQVRSVGEAKAITEEVASATQASAENTQETAEAAAAARSVAEEGARAVAEARDAMRAVQSSTAAATDAIRELGAKSERIGGIVDTITGIAEQTNLLALNAAIEAARAGDQGRGFAVVAEEVRKLAEESQQAAATIAGLIQEIQHDTSHAVEVVDRGAAQTEEGVVTVEHAHEAFVRIGGSVNDMSARIEQIAGAVEQISASSQRMRDSMSDVATVAEESSASSQQVSASTEHTTASTQQIAAAAHELADTADKLSHLVGQFRLASA